MNWSLILGSRLGRVEPFQDGFDAQLAVELRIEKLLIIPKSFAVTDLQERCLRCRRAP